MSEPNANNIPERPDQQDIEGVAPEVQPAGAFNQAPEVPCEQPYEQQPYGYQAYGQAPYAQQTYAYQAAPPAPSKKKSKVGWIVGGVLLLAVMGVFALAVHTCSSAMSDMSKLGSDIYSESSVMTEGESVAVIDIAGTIQYDGTACSPEGLADLLDEAEENDDIKAVVLRVDSGGGTATAGEEMAAYVRDFSKPIVVSSASMNCSAAYEFSSQADYIFVNETTAIGSIGTVMQVTDVSGLLEMLGVSVDNIASADSKDSSYGTRSLTKEERKYYQDLVDTINETFIRNVATGRDMEIAEVRELATGMEFAGVTAVENGLADEVGIYDDALDKAAELGGIKSEDYFVVSLTDEYYDMYALMDLLGAEAASDMTVEELLNLLKEEGISA